MLRAAEAMDDAQVHAEAHYDVDALAQAWARRLGRDDVGSVRSAVEALAAPTPYVYTKLTRNSVRFPPLRNTQRAPLPNRDQQFLFRAPSAKAWSRAQAASHAPHSPGCRSPPNDRLMAGIEPAESSHRRAADAHHMHAPHAHVHLCMWLQE